MNAPESTLPPEALGNKKANEKGKPPSDADRDKEQQPKTPPGDEASDKVKRLAEGQSPDTGDGDACFPSPLRGGVRAGGGRE